MLLFDLCLPMTYVLLLFYLNIMPSTFVNLLQSSSYQSLYKYKYLCNLWFANLYFYELD
jgi:hypothetical protein